MPFDISLHSVITPNSTTQLDEIPSSVADAESVSPTEPLLLALTGIELETAWNDIIDDWTYASDDEVVAARHFIGAMRDRVIESLKDTNDAIEFQTSALLVFTRLKAFWFELNSRLGHHLDPKTYDTSLPLRAGLVAAFLNVMEPYLPTRAIEKVNSFLSAVVADDMENDLTVGNPMMPGPAEVRIKITNMLGTIESLSECVIKQEAELYELQTGQKALQKAFGTTVSFAEIAARMNTLSIKVNALEAQAGLEDVYRNVLSQALGITDPVEVVKEVRNLRDVAKRLEDEMFQMRRENERVSAQFGDDMSPDDALGRLRDAEHAAVSVLEENDALQIRLAAQAERAEAVTRERDLLLGLLNAPDVQSAEAALRTLHENAAAYNDIASLLGDVGKELGKFGV